MNRRLDVVDVARGLALVAMAAYHFTWDLADFQVVAAGVPFTPPMRLASHLIGGTFLALAGYSLALAHGGGFRGRAFAVRLLRVAAAAAAVTAASFYIAPNAPIGFGILHCIVAASLLALPFLRAPRFGAAGALALGLVLLVLPALVASPTLDAPWTIWLGLGDRAPATLDWRPLAPWAGVALIGLALGLAGWRPPAWPARRAPARALSLAGRHSLAIYLIHQPILFGLLYACVHLSGFSERQAVESYVRHCRPACVEAGGDIDACDHACACVVRDARAAGLSERLGARDISREDQRRIGDIAETCGSEAR